MASSTSNRPLSKDGEQWQRLLDLLRLFWRDFLSKYRGRFAWVATLMVASVLLQLPVPLLTMYIIDSAVESGNLTLVDQLALAFAALVALRHVFMYLNETLTLRLKEKIIVDVELRLYRHLQSLPLRFFSQRHSTYLQSRLMGDSRAIEGALVRTVVNLAMNTLTFLIGAVIILFIRYELGVVLILSVLPFAYIRYYGNRRMRELSQDMQEQQASTSAVVSERLSGIRTIKVLLQEREQEAVVSSKLEDLQDVYVKTNLFGILSSTGTSLITSLCVPFVLWYGLRSVVAGSMSLGEVVGILSLLSFLYAPVNSLVASNLSLQRAASALQRIYEFLGHRPEAREGRPLEEPRGKIDFRNVSFGYEADGEVLKGLSLSIAPGETVALVGRSGAGKSTLVNLLLRFYEPESGQGEILFDGQDIRSLDLESLRSAVGLVDQQTFLFTGTIAENIRLGRPGANIDKVVEASRQAQAHDFIETLPDGYDTKVGERGTKLSGGECQRIALARVLLRDPPVLVLDEAVSAVDSESEYYIQEALTRIAADRTTLVIAHRLSSLLLAKRVVLIEDGRVVEEGSHEDLLRANGAYARLFRQQFAAQVSPQAEADTALSA